MVVRRHPKPLFIALIAIIAIILIGLGSYLFLISPTNAFDNQKIEVVIPKGTSTSKIATILKNKGLIRATLIFRVNVFLHGKSSLKATTYELKKSMSLNTIINILSNGNSYDSNLVNITFKEGKRMTDYAKVISEKTNHSATEVLTLVNDKNYLAKLITKYWFLTNSILNTGIYYPLEGYLAPDTYQFKNKNVTINTIIETLLNEEEKRLAPYKNLMLNDPHKYTTMASLVELEGTNTTNRKMIAGIFNNRLAAGMNLGSDVTTYYALQYPMTASLTSSQFATVNPYNTRASNMGGKLPIGPICSVSLSSIEASVNPTTNDYFYFVADKNGQIYYSKTLAEHTAKIKELKEAGKWLW